MRILERVQSFFNSSNIEIFIYFPPSYIVTKLIYSQGENENLWENVVIRWCAENDTILICPKKPRLHLDVTHFGKIIGKVQWIESKSIPIRGAEYVRLTLY